MAKNRSRTKRLLTDELYIPNAFKQDLCTSKINEIRKKKNTIKKLVIVFSKLKSTQVHFSTHGLLQVTLRHHGKKHGSFGN